ncbi:MAG: isoprenyl transferase [Paludibacteraceae bacterium]|nr:isoprenyl transferase [Paludibacteraceae bacterium]MBR4839228.1 isoprenyl transferase [Paludibacteraceae bacterium]
MTYREQIRKDRIPRHIAIIMDGNGRWAKARGKERFFGHQNGVLAVDKITVACVELGVEYLTLYAFSTENWNRPTAEVDFLMDLMSEAIKKYIEKACKNNVRLLVIGDMSRLTDKSRNNLNEAMRLTEKNDGLKLVIALSYSSRWEIVDAVKKIAEKAKSGELDPSQIDEDLVSNHLTTAGIPDPDLMIRTSGEYRISNFLMWQLSYSELYFTETLWPDFDEEELSKAIVDYQKRERRFGKTSEQISK